MRALGLAAALLAGSITPGLCSGYDDLNAGIELHNRGQWDAAIAALEKALAANDLNTDQQYIAHVDRAQAREAKGDWDGALADFNACVALRPGDDTALFTRAVFYINRDKPEEAQQDLDLLVAKSPADPGFHAYRAEAYEMEGNAEEELADLLAEQPEDAKNKFTPLMVGIAYYQLGKADKAAALFVQSSDAAPGYAWLWLAMADLKQGKPVPVDVSTGLEKGKWPGPLIDFFQGRSAEETVTAIAAQGDTKNQRGQICEANFYLGEWRSLHGDAAGAKPFFGKAASDCPRNFTEWFWVEEELKNAQ